MKKFLCMLLSFAILSSVCCVAAFAENVNQTTETVNSGWIPDEYDRSGVTASEGVYGLPSSYDPRNSGYLTTDKDQAFTDLCWLFAAAGAIEQKTSKKYGSKFDISEAHAATAL